jgi:hypothetical protein
VPFFTTHQLARLHNPCQAGRGLLTSGSSRALPVILVPTSGSSTVPSSSSIDNITAAAAPPFKVLLQPQLPGSGTPSPPVNTVATQLVSLQSLQGGGQRAVLSDCSSSAEGQAPPTKDTSGAFHTMPLLHHLPLHPPPV